jgi:hypothetical protein
MDTKPDLSTRRKLRRAFNAANRAATVAAGGPLKDRADAPAAMLAEVRALETVACWFGQLKPFHNDPEGYAVYLLVLPKGRKWDRRKAERIYRTYIDHGPLSAELAAAVAPDARREIPFAIGHFSRLIRTRTDFERLSLCVTCQNCAHGCNFGMSAGPFAEELGSLDGPLIGSSYAPLAEGDFVAWMAAADKAAWPHLFRGIGPDGAQQWERVPAGECKAGRYPGRKPEDRKSPPNPKKKVDALARQIARKLFSVKPEPPAGLSAPEIAARETKWLEIAPLIAKVLGLRKHKTNGKWDGLWDGRIERLEAFAKVAAVFAAEPRALVLGRGFWLGKAQNAQKQTRQPLEDSPFKATKFRPLDFECKRKGRARQRKRRSDKRPDELPRDPRPDRGDNELTRSVAPANAAAESFFVMVATQLRENRGRDGAEELSKDDWEHARDCLTSDDLKLLRECQPASQAALNVAAAMEAQENARAMLRQRLPARRDNA